MAMAESVYNQDVNNEELNDELLLDDNTNVYNNDNEQPSNDLPYQKPKKRIVKTYDEFVNAKAEYDKAKQDGLEDEYDYELDKSFTKPSNLFEQLYQERFGAEDIATLKRIDAEEKRLERNLYEQGFGNSIYDLRDKGFIDIYDVNNLEAYRGERQYGIEKILLGIPKFFGKAGTTIVNSVAGTVYGTGEALFHGADALVHMDAEKMKWSAIWDNAVTRAMYDVDKYFEETFRVYRDIEAQTIPWYKNLSSATTISDAITNAGFTVGAVTAGILTGNVLSLTGMKSVVGGLASSTLSSAGESSVEAISNVQAFKELQYSELEDAYKRARNNLEERIKNKYKEEGLNKAKAGMSNFLDELEKIKNGEYDYNNSNAGIQESSIGSKNIEAADKALKKNSRESLLNDFINSHLAEYEYAMGMKDLSDGYLKAYKDINDRAAKLGATQFGLNMLILMPSNLIQFGRLFSAPFNNAAQGTLRQRVAQTVKDWSGLNVSIPKAAGKSLERGVIEMSEEMTQSFVGEFSSDVVAYTDPNAYYKMLTDKEFHGKMMSFLPSLSDAFAKSYGNIDAWQEGYFGFIMGLLGSPTITRSANRSSETWLGRGKFFGWSGGVLGEFSTRSYLNNVINYNVEQMNKIYNDMSYESGNKINADSEEMGKRRTLLENLMGALYLNRVQTNDNGDVDNSTLTEFEKDPRNLQFSILYSYARTGHLDFIENMLNFNADELSNNDLLAITSLFISPNSQDFRDATGALLVNTEEGREKMRQVIKDNLTTIKDQLNVFKKVSEEVLNNLPDSPLLEEEMRTNLMWQRWRAELAKTEFNNGVQDKEYLALLERLNNILFGTKNEVKEDNNTDSDNEESTQPNRRVKVVNSVKEFIKSLFEYKDELSMDDLYDIRPRDYKKFINDFVKLWNQNKGNENILNDLRSFFTRINNMLRNSNAYDRFNRNYHIAIQDPIKYFKELDKEQKKQAEKREEEARQQEERKENATRANESYESTINGDEISEEDKQNVYDNLEDDEKRTTFNTINEIKSIVDNILSKLDDTNPEHTAIKKILLSFRDKIRFLVTNKNFTESDLKNLDNFNSFIDDYLFNEEGFETKYNNNNFTDRFFTLKTALQNMLADVFNSRVTIEPIQEVQKQVQVQKKKEKTKNKQVKETPNENEISEVKEEKSEDNIKIEDVEEKSEEKKEERIEEKKEEIADNKNEENVAQGNEQNNIASIFGEYDKDGKKVNQNEEKKTKLSYPTLEELDDFAATHKNELTKEDKDASSDFFFFLHDYDSGVQTNGTKTLNKDNHGIPLHSVGKNSFYALQEVDKYLREHDAYKNMLTIKKGDKLVFVVDPVLNEKAGCFVILIAKQDGNKTIVLNALPFEYSLNKDKTLSTQFQSRGATFKRFYYNVVYNYVKYLNQSKSNNTKQWIVKFNNKNATTEITDDIRPKPIFVSEHHYVKIDGNNSICFLNTKSSSNSQTIFTRNNSTKEIEEVSVDNSHINIYTPISKRFIKFSDITGEKYEGYILNGKQHLCIKNGDDYYLIYSYTDSIDTSTNNDVTQYLKNKFKNDMNKSGIPYAVSQLFKDDIYNPYKTFEDKPISFDNDNFKFTISLTKNKSGLNVGFNIEYKVEPTLDVREQIENAIFDILSQNKCMPDVNPEFIKQTSEKDVFRINLHQHDGQYEIAQLNSVHINPLDKKISTTRKRKQNATNKESSSLNTQSNQKQEYNPNNSFGFGNNLNFEDLSSEERIAIGKELLDDIIAQSPTDNPSLKGESFEVLHRKVLKDVSSSSLNKETEKEKEQRLKHELELISNILPQLSHEERLVVVRSIESLSNDPDYNVYGYYTKGAIYIAEHGEKGTAYHEAFHFVTQALLTDKERDELYAAAKSKYGKNLPNIELEEKLAEDFRLYYEIEEDPGVSSIRRFFRRIKHILESVFSPLSNRMFINSFYYNIASRKFAQREVLVASQSDNEFQMIQDFYKNKLAYNNLDTSFTDFLNTNDVSKEDWDNLPMNYKVWMRHCFVIAGL